MDFATHHLPEYFIGVPEEALQTCDDVAARVGGIEAKSTRERLERDMRQSRQLVLDWIRFRAEGGLDFDAWCRARDRRCEWIAAVYYEEK